MDGLIVIDKPSGPTSHDVVARMRGALAERRVGHTGTLDPSATGVLPLVLGRATRLARFLSARDKRYEAVIRLGLATDTYDAQGEPSGTPHDGPWPSHFEIDRALDAFRGTFVQQPPAFSAKKIDGKRSYLIARSGAPQTARRGRGRSLPAPVVVTARTIDIVSVDGGRVTLLIDCSAGFYVRSLAHDLGDRLGIGAHLMALRRTRSGDLTLADALPLDVAERDRDAARAAVIPLDRMLPGLLAVVLTDAGARRVTHGRDLGSADIAEGGAGGVRPPDSAPHGIGLETAAPQCVRLMTGGGHLLGIAEPTKTPGLLHPSVVLV